MEGGLITPPALIGTGLLMGVTSLSSPRITEVRERGYPFIVQYTFFDYPRSMETSVVDAVRSVQQMVQLTKTYGA
jgi:hypothetical protein